MPPAEARVLRSRSVLLAAIVALVLAIFWIATLPASPTYGWDESMNVALPAARMRIALLEGHPGLAFDALLGCAQYPFVQPVALALVQSVCGAGEHVARAFGIVEWAATLLGVFVLVRCAMQAAADARHAERAELAAWIAFACAALSSLSLIFAGTLFLEVPSACVTVWTLVAWITFWRQPTKARAIGAGALVAAGIFTKWNYGLLVAAGLALDVAVRLVPRAGRAERLRAAVHLSWVPVISLAWWFCLPLPGGVDVAAGHRDALIGFLAGNIAFQRTPGSLRALDLVCMLAPSPRLFVVELAGLIAALWLVRGGALRTLVIVLAAAWVPVFAHPFFQDRFLVPAGPIWFATAGIGLAAFLSRVTRRGGWPARVPDAAWIGAAVLIALAVLPLRSKNEPVDVDTVFVARALGLVEPATTGAPAVQREYALNVIAGRQTLGARRALPSAGLERDEADTILDLVAREARPDERVGWLGMSSEMSPAMVLIGRLERGGERAQFLRDAAAAMGTDSDPHADAAAVRAFARPFDVVFLTDPPDLKGRKSALWAARARTALMGGGGWVERELGEVETARPPQPPLRVKLIACRRAK